MTGKRIYEYAKELGLENDELIERLYEYGIIAENHLSVIPEEKINPLRSEFYQHKGGQLSVEKLAQILNLTPEFIQESLRLLKADPLGKYNKLDSQTVKIITAPQKPIKVEELARRLHTRPKNILKLLSKLNRPALHTRSKIDPITVNILEKIQISGIKEFIKTKKMIESGIQNEQYSMPISKNGVEEDSSTSLSVSTDENLILEEKVARWFKFRKMMYRFLRPQYILIIVALLLIALILVFVNQRTYSKLLKETNDKNSDGKVVRDIRIGLPLSVNSSLPLSFEEKISKIGAFAWLVIPRLNLNSPVLEGVSPENLQEGPAYFTKSAKPGQGVTIIYGYQRLGKAPFAGISSLHNGDFILLYTREEGFLYSVGIKNGNIIEPNNNDVNKVGLKLIQADGQEYGYTNKEVSALFQGNINEL